MNTSKKRIVSLFIALVLILSFSAQAPATAESPALTQKSLGESEKNKLSLSLTQISIDDGLKLIDVESQPEPELKPDPKPDEVTLGASGREETPQLDTDSKADELSLGAFEQEEKPAAGPTITPFATQDFNILGDTGKGKLMIDPITSQGKMLFVNESGISFNYSSLAYGEPYRYTTPSPDWDTIADNRFTIDLVSRPEGILEYSLEAALTSDANGSSNKPPNTWSYDNAQVYILIQRVKSYTTVTGSTNPTAINVGRESANDIYSGDPAKPPTFFWEITKVGDPTSALSGKDSQPDMDDVDYLTAGDYIVTTTAKEFLVEGYENIGDNGDSVSNTTSADFKVTVGNVIVEHIDDDTGDAISAPTTIVGTSKGDPYTTSREYILGYELVAEPTNKDGFFSADDQTVTYKYKKAITKVIVEHVYGDGTPVISPITTTGPFGTTVNTVQLIRPEIEIIDVEVNAASQGSTDNYLATYPPIGATTVTYVYKDNGSLVLLNVPSLQFGTHAMAGTTMIYPLTQEAVLSVKDNRATHGNWKISVSASQLTGASDTKTLDPDALGFMNQGEFVSLRDSRIVWESSTSLTDPIQDKIWQEGNSGEGFVVKLLPFQATADSYQAFITWTLENTP